MLAVANPRAVINPADKSEIVGYVHLADLEIVDSAFTAAAHAMPAWSANSEASRIQAVGAAIAAIDQVRPPEAFSRLMTREQGKPLFESAYESTRHRHLLDLSFDMTRRAESIQARIACEEHRRHRRVSGGPVVIITSGCWPVAFSMAKVIPALLAGNTVVLKPAPTMPLAVSIMLCAMARRLPPGVLNIVQGAGDIGNALVRHPYEERALKVASQLEAGQVFANRHAGAAVHAYNACDGGQRSIRGQEQRPGSRPDYMDTSLLCSSLLFDF